MMRNDEGDVTYVGVYHSRAYSDGDEIRFFNSDGSDNKHKNFDKV